MAAHSRFLRGETKEILAPIRGNVVVEAGDFMVRNSTAGMISEAGTTGDGIAVDGYAYPFNDVENSATSETSVLALLYNAFIGIAMESSPSGVTESISVATDGVFKYPMIGGPGGVTVGSLVSATSPATGTGVSVQMVARTTTSPGSTAYLGRIVKTESGASFVDFQIKTIYTGLAS